MVKSWVDASDPGSGNWLKYVRSCSDELLRNVMAVQRDDRIYYKATRDIEVGSELLLYNDDAVLPEYSESSSSSGGEFQQVVDNELRRMI